MRLVLDTNAALSALLWHGTPGKLIDAAQRKTVFLFTSAPLLAELRGVLERAKLAKQLQLRGLTPAEVAEGYAALASVVIPAVIAPAVPRDPPDDIVLATALAAQADLIVSGDLRVLNLKSYQGIPILAPAEAAKRLPQT